MGEIATTISAPVRKQFGMYEGIAGVRETCNAFFSYDADHHLDFDSASNKEGRNILILGVC